MEWTTARKGRRSKSRDVLKDSPQTSTSVATNSTSGQNPELSIDFNLDLQTQRQTNTTSTGNNISGTFSPDSTTSAGGGGGEISSLLTGESKSRPPMLRRISGGWADSASGSKQKSKKGSFDDERFGIKSSENTSPTDDIPIIPDLDDIKDETIMHEIAQPASFAVNRVVTLKELNSDLLAQTAFSVIEDVDLSILTKCLQPQEVLDEPDEVWEWQKLFTDVVAEIHSDKSSLEKPKRTELKPDEIPETNSD
ncbi:intraflagellar transport protein 43 homolog [Musca vetustissima]|uniref:intraflagellar transport protein 43 homolog n=1 Tax=Musca vetustissima TaxID=27455 RepID=UPI002AB6413A|nr:intraflagellar transport protein 43 homolog [Musca vetustissima]